MRKALAGELEDLRNYRSAEGDSADAAFDAGSEEIASQLAELEARELSKIERALAQIKRGTYGLCEYCQGKIPVARLNALPYSTTCIKCQREMEHSPGWDGEGRSSWDKVSDSDASFESSREVNLADIELDLSK